MVTDNTNIADLPEFDDTPDLGLNPIEGVAPVAGEVVSDTTAPAVETPAPTAAVTPEPTPLPNSDQAQLQQQMAQMQQQQAEMERDRTIKQLEQEALQMEQRLTDQGLSESEARNQTMGHLQNQVSRIQVAQQQNNQQNIVQGRRNAAIHFAKQYGLGIDDLANLERSNSPAEMEAMAKNQSDIAKLRAENEQLKRGQVPTQQLDNNSPAPAANATNDDRLIDAYLNDGDRSEAAVNAVRKLGL